MRAIRRRAAPRAEDRPLSPSSRSIGGSRRADADPAPAASRARRSGGGSPVPDRPAGASAGWQRLRRTAPSALRRASRRSRSHAPTSRDRRDNTPIGQDIERDERLRQGHGAAQRDKRDRCRQVHGARSFDHGCQGRRAVEPRRLKQEVVISGNRRKATLARGVDCASNTRERLPLAPEFHQGQVNGEFHPQPILSLHGPHVERHAAPP